MGVARWGREELSGPRIEKATLSGLCGKLPVAERTAVELVQYDDHI